MTYKTKNATIVFAFAALLMAMPLAQVAVAEETTSSITAACGFTTQNIVVPAITRDALQAEGTEATFPLTGGANTATGTFSVTASENWQGDGDRASTTIVVTAPDGRAQAIQTVTATGEITTGDVLTIGGTEAFEATSGDAGANVYDNAGTGTDVDLALLAAAINEDSAKVTAAVTATNTITLTAKAGTTAAVGNAITVVMTTGTSITATASPMAGGADGDKVTINTFVYEAVNPANDAKTDNLDFLVATTNVVTAENLAVSIRAQDSAVRATNDNTATTTVLAFVRGTGGNGFTVATTDDPKLDVTGTFFAGGGANVKDHLLAEKTKFFVTKDGTTASTGQDYDTQKFALNAKTVIKEMVAQTNDDKNLRVTFQTDTRATLTPTGLVTLVAAEVGDIVTVNGLQYIAVSGTHAGDNTKFDIDDASDDVDAADLAASITADTRTGLFGDVTAAAVTTNIITITHGDDGIFGNQTPLATSTAVRAAVSGATLGVGAGTVLGAEPLFNLPYDGALKLAVTFTVDCT